MLEFIRGMVLGLLIATIIIWIAIYFKYRIDRKEELKGGNENMGDAESLEEAEKKLKEIKDKIELEKAKKKVWEAEKELKSLKPKSQLQKMFRQ